MRFGKFVSAKFVTACGALVALLGDGSFVDRAHGDQRRGQGRFEFALICYDTNGIPLPWSDKVDACADAMLPQNQEVYVVYEHYCLSSHYDKTWCKLASQLFDTKKISEVCCPRDLPPAEDLDALIDEERKRRFDARPRNRVAEGQRNMMAAAPSPTPIASPTPSASGTTGGRGARYVS